MRLRASRPVEVIPRTRLEDRRTPIDLRVFTQANGDVVNRPGAVLVHAVRNALAGVTARKFIDLVAPVRGQDTAQRLLAVLRQIEDADDVSVLLDLAALPAA